MTERAPVPHGSQPVPDSVAYPFGPANPDGDPSQLAGVGQALTGQTDAEGTPIPPLSPDSAAAAPATSTEGDPGAASASPDAEDNTDTLEFPAVKLGDIQVMPAVTGTAPPEASTAEGRDAAARYRDAVLLNRSYRVRRTIHEGGTQSIKGWQWSRAKLANALDSPGKYRRGFAVWRAERGLERKQERLALAKNSLQWQTRRRKVAEAQTKVDDHRGRLKMRTDRMESRRTAVTTNAEARRKAHTEELVRRKKDALIRKEVRKASDLSRFRPRDRRELNQILEMVPRDRLDALAKVAIETGATSYIRQRTEKTERWASRRLARTQDSVARIGERITQYDDKVEEADKHLKELNEALLPDARKRVEALRAELGDAVDDEAERARLTAELEEAEGTVSAHEASLSDWSKVRSKNTRRSGRATRHGAALQSKLNQRSQFANAASERADEWRSAELEDEDRLDREVVVTLDPRRSVATHSRDEGRKAA